MDTMVKREQMKGKVSSLNKLFKSGRFEYDALKNILIVYVKKLYGNNEYVLATYKQDDYIETFVKHFDTKARRNMTKNMASQIIQFHKFFNEMNIYIERA